MPPHPPPPPEAMGTHRSWRLYSSVGKAHCDEHVKGSEDSRKEETCLFPGALPWSPPLFPKGTKVLLWPKGSLSNSVTEKGNQRANWPPQPPGPPRGLLLAGILGWQGHKSDPQGTIALSPFGAGPGVPGREPRMARSKPEPSPEAARGAFRPGDTPRGQGTHSLAPLTSGSPSRAGGHRSRGCSGYSPVPSRAAGRCTGRSPGRRVSAC